MTWRIFLESTLILYFRKTSKFGLSVRLLSLTLHQETP